MTKRNLALLVLLSSAIAELARQPTAHADDSGREGRQFGIGIGAGTIANGLSLKLPLGENALQGVIGILGGGGADERFRHADGVAASLDYLWEMPSLARSPYFSIAWSFGPGAGFGVRTREQRAANLAVSGVAGLEFNFLAVPLDLVVEYRPTVEIAPHPRVELVDFTGHLRFYFR